MLVRDVRWLCPIRLADCYTSAMFKNLPLLANLALFLFAAVVVWRAGTRLAQNADAISTKTGIGQAVIGILLLGGVTSLPELAVAMTATLTGAVALSVNDVLGSASVNVLILAVADAAYGRKALTSSPGSPQVLLQAGLGIILLSCVVGASISTDIVVLGAGIWSWFMLAVYIGAIWLIAKSQGLKSWVPDQGLGRRSGQVSSTGEDGQKKGSDAGKNGGGDDRSMSRIIAGTSVAALFILAAGFVLARTADALAHQTGMGTSFTGVVLLAMATSLPEVSTVLAAVRLGRNEMAMADVFGTNLFNVTIIALVDFVHPGGPVLQETGQFAAFGAVIAIILTAVFLVGLVERRDRTWLRLGLDSMAAICIYAAGIGVLYLIRPT